MKTQSSITQAILLSLTLSAAAHSAYADDPERDLEPCMNGGVSASGLYNSQERESGFTQYSSIEESGQFE